MSELERLRDERDHLRVKLSMAMDRSPDEILEHDQLRQRIDGLVRKIHGLVVDHADRALTEKRRRHDNPAEGA